MTHRSARSMRCAAAQAGRDAEDAAACLVQAAGFTLIARNYHCRGGELDIVARRAQLLLIAEVRLRSSASFGGAAASISSAKRRRIQRAARHLIARHPALARLIVRFDVLLTASPAGPFEWLEAAF